MFISRRKLKKYKRLQIIIKNEGLSEGFGIFQIVKTFTVGNYAKKIKEVKYGYR